MTLWKNLSYRDAEKLANASREFCDTLNKLKKNLKLNNLDIGEVYMRPKYNKETHQYMTRLDYFGKCDSSVRHNARNSEHSYRSGNKEDDASKTYDVYQFVVGITNLDFLMFKYNLSIDLRGKGQKYDNTNSFFTIRDEARFIRTNNTVLDGCNSNYSNPFIYDPLELFVMSITSPNAYCFSQMLGRVPNVDDACDCIRWYAVVCEKYLEKNENEKEEVSIKDVYLISVDERLGKYFDSIDTAAAQVFKDKKVKNVRGELVKSFDKKCVSKALNCICISKQDYEDNDRNIDKILSRYGID